LGDNLTLEQISNWTSQGYSKWGKYSIKGDHKGNPTASNSYIGAGEPQNTLKIWRYKPAEMRLYFATIITGEVGGGLKHGETTIGVKDDLTLYNAIYSGSKIKPVNGQEYSNGYVDVPSWIQPFIKGTLYWMPSDN